EADRFALAGGEQDVVFLGQLFDSDQPVGWIRAVLAVVAVLTLGNREFHCDLAGGGDVGEGVHAVAANRAVGGGEHDVQAAPGLLVFRQGQNGGNGFAFAQRQQ